jgi:hypothetical protein
MKIVLHSRIGGLKVKIVTASALMALLSMAASSVRAQTAPQQIGPGSTANITQGANGPAGDKPHKMLNGALTPQTRQTLQEAMNSSSGPAPTK